MLYLLKLKKARPVEKEEGVLTRTGRRIAVAYARKWVAQVRALDLERAYPSLQSLFLDIRRDSALAREYEKD
jgi:hypothetical protein